uniref:BTB domain-containing protein n=1 Tax=Parascaris univalens TaxID=6257 RepID=A0A914ZVG6_PARUN
MDDGSGIQIPVVRHLKTFPALSQGFEAAFLLRVICFKSGLLFETFVSISSPLSAEKSLFYLRS